MSRVLNGALQGNCIPLSIVPSWAPPERLPAGHGIARSSATTAARIFGPRAACREGPGAGGGRGDRGGGICTYMCVYVHITVANIHI